MKIQVLSEIIQKINKLVIKEQPQVLVPTNLQFQQSIYHYQMTEPPQNQHILSKMKKIRPHENQN